MALRAGALCPSGISSEALDCYLPFGLYPRTTNDLPRVKLCAGQTC